MNHRIDIYFGNNFLENSRNQIAKIILSFYQNNSVNCILVSNNINIFEVKNIYKK